MQCSFFSVAAIFPRLEDHIVDLTKDDTNSTSF